MKQKGTALALALFMAGTAVTGAMAATMEGDANVDGRTYPAVMPFVHPPFYNVKLTVESDDSGKITAVKDNGTGLEGSVETKEMEEKWGKKNKPYWDAAMKSGLLDKFVGKTAEEVAGMMMATGEQDAVTGATLAGQAAREAVLNALSGKKGKTFLPGTGSMLPVASQEMGSVMFDSRLPKDFEVSLLDIRWGVKNAEENILPMDQYTFEMKDGKASLTFKDAAMLKPGKYFINITDASNTYRSPNFEAGHGEEDMSQAPYFIVDSGLTEKDVMFKDGMIVLEKGDIAAFMQNVKHVQVLADGMEKPMEQELVGHHGTVNAKFNALDMLGRLNPAASNYDRKEKKDIPLFESGKTYHVTVEAYGFPAVHFDYTAK